MESAPSAEKAKELLLERLYSTNHEQIGKGELVSSEITPESRREAFSTIKGALEHTIHHGYSSSLIIRGPTGSGKSWLMGEVLKSLNSDPKCKGLFLLVRLNGLIHTDDHQALLDVAAQLGLAEEQGKMVKMSFLSALKYLMEALGRGDRGKKSVIFIMEAFECFIEHKNQTLLYNLLDVAQTDHTPIAVIGLTTCINAPDLLEKRVRSRLSFRQVNLDLDFNFYEYIAIFKSLLSLPGSFEDKTFLRRWRSHLEELAKNSSVLDTLRKMYNISPNLHWLRLSLAVAVSQSHSVEPSDLKDSVQLLISRYSVSSTLSRVSVLEFTLVIAIHHLTTLSERDPFNFEMVYNEYKKFAQRSQSARFWDKKVVMKAFERLILLELVHPIAQSARKTTNKEYQLMTSGVSAVELREAVKQFPNCPTDLSRWGLSQSMRS